MAGAPPAWAAWLAAAALVLGLSVGVRGAWSLPAAERLRLGQGVAGYLQARAGGRPAVLWPATTAWVRAAAPVWAAGLWPKVGVALVALSLGLHGFALGFACGTAAALGRAGLGAALLAVLPGNLLGLPALWWLATRAAALSAARRGGLRPLPGGYLWLGLVVGGGVLLSSVAEAVLGPVLLRAAGMGLR